MSFYTVAFENKYTGLHLLKMTPVNKKLAIGIACNKILIIISVIIWNVYSYNICKSNILNLTRQPHWARLPLLMHNCWHPPFFLSHGCIIALQTWFNKGLTMFPRVLKVVCKTRAELPAITARPKRERQ